MPKLKLWIYNSWKNFQLLKYFGFIATNWGLALAFKIIKSEYSGDKNLGIHTIGNHPLHSKMYSDVDVTHATIYMPMPYYYLNQIANEISLDKFNHLVDLGSGKGRILAWAATHGIPKVTGIEMASTLALQAQQNLQLLQHKNPAFDFSLFCIDAADYQFENTVDLIFLFNPFDAFVLQQVIQNLERSLSEQPRDVTIIYCTPLYKNILFEHGFKQTSYAEPHPHVAYAIFKNNR